MLFTRPSFFLRFIDLILTYSSLDHPFSLGFVGLLQAFPSPGQFPTRIPLVHHKLSLSRVNFRPVSRWSTTSFPFPKSISSPYPVGLLQAFPFSSQFPTHIPLVHHKLSLPRVNFCPESRWSTTSFPFPKSISSSNPFGPPQAFSFSGQFPTRVPLVFYKLSLPQVNFRPKFRWSSTSFPFPGSISSPNPVGPPQAFPSPSQFLPRIPLVHHKLSLSLVNFRPVSRWSPTRFPFPKSISSPYPVGLLQDFPSPGQFPTRVPLVHHKLSLSLVNFRPKFRWSPTRFPFPGSISDPCPVGPPQAFPFPSQFLPQIPLVSYKLSLSRVQFSIFSLDKYPYGVYITSIISIPPQGISYK